MPAPVPRATRRLDSISQSKLGRPKPAQRPAPKRATCCDEPKIEDEDGMKVCVSCGTQISESNIVADVTFGEDSRGAATVQGGFIGETARHARTLGTGAFRRIGGGERNTMAEIESNGRRALNALCPRLSIPDNVSVQAQALWALAAKNNFNAGRKTDEVVAACLYAACRRQKENTVLLMDISELLHINVFRLGVVYKDLVKELYLGGDDVGIQHLVEVEPLIIKYCRKLEFGDATRQVAEDAIKIVRRMKRDWMVTGRHPAGLCGACIILAARMNNFRRSVREVVYVSKVADITVAKRVEEFRRTQAAALTVEQFRQLGTRLKHQHDPPSFTDYDLKKQRFEEKKRKRQERTALGLDSAASSPAPLSAVSTPAPDCDIVEGSANKRQRVTEPENGPMVAQEPRFDADGFAIPALPIDPTKHGQGRRRKNDIPEAYQPTEDELVEERELEDEITETLENDQVIDSRNELERAKDEERARILADQQRQIAATEAQARREAEGFAWPTAGTRNNDTPTAEDLEAEFADDPEVNNCLLSERERSVKERIWVAHNEDWLRTQHEKELIRQISEAAGGREKSKRGAKGGKRKKRSKMGDGSLLNEAGTPVETPADANNLMVAKRAPAAFSKYVNYEALAKVYGEQSASTSANVSRASSEVPQPVPESAETQAEAGAEHPSDLADEDEIDPDDYASVAGSTADVWDEDYDEGDIGDDDDYNRTLDPLSTVPGAGYGTFEDEGDD
ncbi:Hypothetical protein R9X50_00569800 [Acrodontium crateriforme]|uniref:Cyclin-like domain-containing protein n=1 Tax=Acrodontium crateriforme TaxID=150365 RepID=A0AAQ3M7P5_9PEZI|nr:Hypothetical protein R9X50_00569800 [Acrodontium crateriforme]